jgi:hypothetical protein
MTERTLLRAHDLTGMVPAPDHAPLLEQLATLQRENAVLHGENAALRVENAALQERVRELEARPCSGAGGAERLWEV